MFLNTRAAFDKILSDIKRFCYGTGIALNTVYIISMLYAILTERGILPLNILFLTVAVAYFFYHVFTYWDKTKSKEKRRVRKAYKIFKIFADASALSVTVYSLYITSEEVTFISLLLAVVSFFSWIFNILSELIIGFAENRKELLLSAFLTDMKPVTAPVNAVNSFVKRMQGEEEPERIFSVSEKTKSKIDKLRSRFVEKKNREKEKKKLSKLKQQEKEKQTANK